MMDNANRTTQALAWIALVIVGLWAITPVVVSRLTEQPGVFGDQYGSINALFSGLAFLGVIYAIVLQREELQLQRNELALTRGEVSRQREIMESQRKILEKQGFEATFFQLMRMHNEIVGSIDLREKATGTVTQSGRDCFETFYRRFRKRYYAETIINKPTPELINRIYVEAYKELEPEVGHYFRSLYNIIKFIHTSEVENKRLYTNLIRAQLSSHELSLLFYNCLSDLGREKFKPLVEMYSLLKMVPRKDLVSADIEMSFYESTAFRGDT